MLPRQKSKLSLSAIPMAFPVPTLRTSTPSAKPRTGNLLKTSAKLWGFHSPIKKEMQSKINFDWRTDVCSVQPSKAGEGNIRPAGHIQPAKAIFFKL
jgi:hypothetical protein